MTTMEGCDSCPPTPSLVVRADTRFRLRHVGACLLHFVCSTVTTSLGLCARLLLRMGLGQRGTPSTPVPLPHLPHPSPACHTSLTLPVRLHGTHCLHGCRLPCRLCAAWWASGCGASVGRSVFLVGPLSALDLQQQFVTQPLTVELHDRVTAGDCGRPGFSPASVEKWGAALRAGAASGLTQFDVDEVRVWCCCGVGVGPRAAHWEASASHLCIGARA
jgi:hypothetical protein